MASICNFGRDTAPTLAASGTRIGVPRCCVTAALESDMKIRVGCDLTYEFAAPTPVVLMLNVHPSRAADVLVPDLIRVAPLRPLSVYTDTFGNICCRLVAPAGELRIVTDTIVQDSGLPEP